VLPDEAASQAAALANEKNLTPAQAVQKRIDAVRQGAKGSRVAGVLPGQYRGKNVIMIQVETLQSLVIGKKYRGKEITPNLNKLVAQSWYFPNTFAQTSSGNTVDAEFTVNTSLLAPLDAASSVKYSTTSSPGCRGSCAPTATMQSHCTRTMCTSGIARGSIPLWDSDATGTRATSRTTTRCGMPLTKCCFATG
jgi:hypothetical protein